MAQNYDFDARPICTFEEIGYKPVIVIDHNNYEHHILFSLTGNEPAQSIRLFLEKCDKTMIGFDLEWIPTKLIPNYVPDDYITHVECKAKEIVCTMQFGCANMSLILFLPWIYFNDKLNKKIPWNNKEIKNLIAGKMTCFNGNNDLRILRANYPSIEIICDKIWDPIIILHNFGADRPNLISMANLLLGFKSTKKKPNINWLYASIGRLVQAGEDAILSYLIYDHIKTADKGELSRILKEHTQKETAEIRKSRIIQCRDPIIKKIYYNLNDKEDGIGKSEYITTMNSFLGTMKLPDIKWDIDESINNLPRWRCIVTIDLKFSMLQAIGYNDIKKEAKHCAVRSLLKHSNFKSTLDRFLD